MMIRCGTAEAESLSPFVSMMMLVMRDNSGDVIVLLMMMVLGGMRIQSSPHIGRGMQIVIGRRVSTYYFSSVEDT